MSKLVLTLDGKVVNQYFIDKPSITIGRDAANDIAIDDAQLSRVHASIVTLGKDAIFEDLQSRNGSRVNGKPLARQILQHRDVIEIGRHQLRFMSSVIAPDRDFDRTMLIQTVVPPAGSDAAVINVPMASAVKVNLAEGSVVVVAGEAPYMVGQTVRLEGVVTPFGEPGDQMIVLTRRPHGVFVTHVEGRKEPRVNQKVIGTAPHALKAGDLIEGAGYQLRFKG